MFDLFVVGAGPAGCAAAIRAAIAGLKVGLAEGAAFPRDLPGEALYPDVDQLFAELGVAAAIAEAGFIRYPGWILSNSDERNFIPFGGPEGLRFGYQAWRADLDTLLLARARAVGVKVFQPARISSLGMIEGRLSSAQVNGREIRFRHLVDSSGANSLLKRELNLPVKRFSPRLTARYGYVSGSFEQGSMPEFHLHSCAWTWIERVKSDCCQFVQLRLAPEAELPALPPMFNQAKRSRGADVTWRMVPTCAGLGYFLCGDAAAVLDPAASSGVARALTSGLKAAELVVRIHSGNIDEASAAQTYRTWCREQFVSYARQLASRYAELEAPPMWLEQLEELFVERVDESARIGLH